MTDEYTGETLEVKKMYHLHDGWFFDRAEDGRVKIVKRERADTSSPIIAETEVGASEWASVVASVSKLGETGEQYRTALNFHEQE